MFSWRGKLIKVAESQKNWGHQSIHQPRTATATSSAHATRNFLRSVRIVTRSHFVFKYLCCCS